ncbi:unnamed protein product [Strongylus vulgaris]|uniref:GOLD domain-containing protein n=1 Tax=Strongylus vulgaris TaxID=40348 RepID=A0A3P7IS01_STRVU|nr:unnamed protein product [Strongylus vulgaris]
MYYNLSILFRGGPTPFLISEGDRSDGSMFKSQVALAIYLLDEKGEYIGDQATLAPSNALNIELEVFEASTRRVKSNLNRAENEMNLMRTVSLSDRSVAEQNFEKVNWYGTLNTCVMVISAITQVYLIRSLITEGSKLGKFLRKGRL